MPKLENGQELSQEQAENLDLIMNVPLEVTVEIGRTRRRVQEILAFAKGSLVVLDKLAGDQVDLFVNGKCIARGDVVVVDDNFGIRVTEILKKPDLEDVAQLK
jgi:flagellar motor switch protein FliN/FliY